MSKDSTVRSISICPHCVLELVALSLSLSLRCVWFTHLNKNLCRVRLYVRVKQPSHLFDIPTPFSALKTNSPQPKAFLKGLSTLHTRASMKGRRSRHHLGTGGSHQLVSDDESGHASDSSPKEQDRFLPVANVSRIMKRSLPANAKISKEAKETVQECVSEFISFITGEASDKCQREKRKTINGDDLLWAMTTLGFDSYVGPLKAYLNKASMKGRRSRHHLGTGGSHQLVSDDESGHASDSSPKEQDRFLPVANRGPHGRGIATWYAPLVDDWPDSTNHWDSLAPRGLPPPVDGNIECHTRGNVPFCRSQVTINLKPIYIS
ncbi:hypothetical protein C4D60_Mb06t04110 [Musa balbisiana]|uniref:Transcription factor CBF/NF-Y/archaeal histone domain-containing protein n=1 Tax=Musa balbisiana TaxID=52838 RepID=A0A4S8IMX7_MUSBA|nr:hypothetical protein C4D60_Mb06t04110 [Musa balbisiana]